jgi:hypothetical protein
MIFLEQSLCFSVKITNSINYRWLFKTQLTLYGLKATMSLFRAIANSKRANFWTRYLFIFYFPFVKVPVTVEVKQIKLNDINFVPTKKRVLEMWCWQISSLFAKTRLKGNFISGKNPKNNYKTDIYLPAVVSSS